MNKASMILTMTLTLSMFTSCLSCDRHEIEEPPKLSETESSSTMSDVSSENPEEKEYTITYYAVDNGKITEINPKLYIKDGSYPTSYNSGEELYISPLKNGIVDISANEDMEFKGWYADKACTLMYSAAEGEEVYYPEWAGGTRTEYEYSGFRIKVEGDLVFYAKISHGYWIGPY